MGHVPDDREIGVLDLTGAIYLSLLHNVHTGSGAQPTTSIMRTRGCFLGGKWRGREADLSLHSSAEVKKGGTIPPFP
jgi:hypothetical protein